MIPHTSKPKCLNLRRLCWNNFAEISFLSFSNSMILFTWSFSSGNYSQKRKHLKIQTSVEIEFFASWTELVPSSLTSLVTLLFIFWVTMLAILLLGVRVPFSTVLACCHNYLMSYLLNYDFSCPFYHLSIILTGTVRLLFGHFLSCSYSYFICLFFCSVFEQFLITFLVTLMIIYWATF